MKNFTISVCCFTILSTACLFAQENQNAQASCITPLSQAHHVGVDNHYKIGTADNPVTANEYCAFLNSEHIAQDQNDQYAYFFYEDSFMNSNYACGNSADWSYHFPMTITWGHHSTIQENDCITRLNEYTCRYVVIPGRRNYIIDGLTKRSGYASKDAIVFRAFKNWRKNPMAQEICDYLNDRMGGRDSDAEAIKRKYSQDIDRAANFNWLDTLAIAAHDNHLFYTSFKMIDEENRPIITFSIQSNDLSFHEGPIQAIVVPGLEYFRPSIQKLSIN